VLIAASLCALGQSVEGADGQAAENADAALPDPSPAAVDEASAEANNLEKQRRLGIALMTLVGITLCGIALVAMTVLLGNRLRREARKPVPRQSKQDDLWFLKPDKQLPARSNRGVTGTAPVENSSPDEKTESE
jgi:hypothetical protein